jgi:deoxyribodipyrimidine photo-lyase
MCFLCVHDPGDGMLGGDYSSKLAPWLAHGCVSPRHVVAEVRKFEKQRVENKSTYWLIFELTWRDFYKFFAVKHGNAIFLADGTAARGGAGAWKGGAGQWRVDPLALAAWKEGTTVGLALFTALSCNQHTFN